LDPYYLASQDLVLRVLVAGYWNMPQANMKSLAISYMRGIE
jgi:hypothetical protein